jgi:hypothetical protein
MKTAAFLVTAFVTACGGCFDQGQESDGIVLINPADLPACTTAFKSGDTISVRLGDAYNADSQYWWDGSTVPPGAQVVLNTTCGKIDGLQTGSVLTFRLQDLSQAFDKSCDPWLALVTPGFTGFVPESVSLYPQEMVPEILDVTIAASYSKGSLNGRTSEATFGLFTPTKSPNSPLQPRHLPPLVVSRRLAWGTGDDYGGCYDSWVATLEPAL